MSSVASSLAKVALIALAFSAASCRPALVDMYDVLPAIGDPVPFFQYRAFDGNAVNPESLRGAPTVIVLWSTTCSASRLALETVGALHAEYAGKRARVMILAEDNDSTAVSKVFAQAGVTVPVALASGSLRDTFTHDQSVLPWRKAFGLPTFLVLNRKGEVAWRQLGIEQDAKDRLQRLRSVLDSLSVSQ